MRVLGFLVVVLFMILGVIGLGMPHRLFAMAQVATTPTGIYIAAAVRFAIGLVLLSIASRSRFPTILRVFGGLAIVGGFVTLALGSDGARAIVDWVLAQSLIPVRLF